jgi:hypothetical protein
MLNLEKIIVYFCKINILIIYNHENNLKLIIYKKIFSTIKF